MLVVQGCCWDISARHTHSRNHDNYLQHLLFQRTPRALYDSSLQNSKAYSWCSGGQGTSADINPTFTQLNAAAAADSLLGKSCQHSAGLGLLPGSGKSRFHCSVNVITKRDQHHCTAKVPAPNQWLRLQLGPLSSLTLGQQSTYTCVGLGLMHTSFCTGSQHRWCQQANWREQSQVWALTLCWRPQHFKPLETVMQISNPWLL